MKIVMIILATAFTSFASADTTQLNDTQEIFIEIDGQMQSLEVQVETLDFLLSSDNSFYQCNPVDGGWKRCSKATGRCFGAVMPKWLCEDYLKGGGGNR